MSKIPKKIHYCWFGGKSLSPVATKCIESWKKYFPDYEIIEWNESNFDINFNSFAKDAYEDGKYAFFTDVARLYIIYNYGGVYFDTDVEVIKPFGDILENNAFFALESEGNLSTGLGFGAVPHNNMIKEMLADYNHIDYKKYKSKLNCISCPIINSKIVLKHGFSLKENVEKRNGVAVYSSDYMNPKYGYGREIIIHENTVSIHHYDGSWLSKEEIKRAKSLKKLKEKYGLKIGTILYNTLYLPFRIVSKFKQKIRS